MRRAEMGWKKRNFKRGIGGSRELSWERRRRRRGLFGGR